LIEPRSNAEGVRGRWGVGRGFREGMPLGPSPENFSIADLKMVNFDAFCVVF